MTEPKARGITRENVMDLIDRLAQMDADEGAVCECGTCRRSKSKKTADVLAPFGEFRKQWADINTVLATDEEVEKFEQEELEW